MLGGVKYIIMANFLWCGGVWGGVEISRWAFPLSAAGLALQMARDLDCAGGELFDQGAVG